MHVRSIIVFFIGLVCVYDTYLTVLYEEHMLILEQNPIGVYLIKNYGVYGFVFVKSICTIIAITFLLLLNKTKYNFIPVFFFFLQIFLFLYLTFSTPHDTSPLSTDEFGTNPLEHVIQKLIKREI
jgi:hypothetical protein